MLQTDITKEPSEKLSVIIWDMRLRGFEGCFIYNDYTSVSPSSKDNGTITFKGELNLLFNRNNIISEVAKASSLFETIIWDMICYVR